MEKENKPVVAVVTGVGFAVVEMFKEVFEKKAEVVPVYLQTESFSYNALEASFKKMYEAPEFLDGLHPDMIVYASQNGSCLKGEQIINFFEQRYGVPAIASAQEMLRRLKERNIRNILVVSPFSSALNLIEKYFFEKNGVQISQVISTRGHLNEEAEGESQLRSRDMVEMIQAVLTEDIEAIVFDSPTYRAEGMSADLEILFGLPVITANMTLANAVSMELFGEAL